MRTTNIDSWQNDSFFVASENDEFGDWEAFDSQTKDNTFGRQHEKIPRQSSLTLLTQPKEENNRDEFDMSGTKFVPKFPIVRTEISESQRSLFNHKPNIETNSGDPWDDDDVVISPVGSKKGRSLPSRTISRRNSMTGGFERKQTTTALFGSVETPPFGHRESWQSQRGSGTSTSFRSPEIGSSLFGEEDTAMKPLAQNQDSSNSATDRRAMGPTRSNSMPIVKRPVQEIPSWDEKSHPRTTRRSSMDHNSKQEKPKQNDEEPIDSKPKRYRMRRLSMQHTTNNDSRTSSQGFGKHSPRPERDSTGKSHNRPRRTVNRRRTMDNSGTYTPTKQQNEHKQAGHRHHGGRRSDLSGSGMSRSRHQKRSTSRSPKGDYSSRSGRRSMGRRVSMSGAVNSQEALENKKSSRRSSMAGGSRSNHRSEHRHKTRSKNRSSSKAASKKNTATYRSADEEEADVNPDVPLTPHTMEELVPRPSLHAGVSSKSLTPQRPRKSSSMHSGSSISTSSSMRRSHRGDTGKSVTVEQILDFVSTEITAEQILDFVSSTQKEKDGYPSTPVSMRSTSTSGTSVTRALSIDTSSESNHRRHQSSSNNNNSADGGRGRRHRSKSTNRRGAGRASSKSLRQARKDQNHPETAEQRQENASFEDWENNRPAEFIAYGLEQSRQANHRLSKRKSRRRASALA